MREKMKKRNPKAEINMVIGLLDTGGFEFSCGHKKFFSQVIKNVLMIVFGFLFQEFGWTAPVSKIKDMAPPQPSGRANVATPQASLDVTSD